MTRHSEQDMHIWQQTCLQQPSCECVMMAHLPLSLQKRQLQPIPREIDQMLDSCIARSYLWSDYRSGFADRQHLQQRLPEPLQVRADVTCHHSLPRRSKKQPGHTQALYSGTSTSSVTPWSQVWSCTPQAV